MSTETRTPPLLPPCVVAEIPERGRGVVASRSIAGGEVLLTFRGERLPLNRLKNAVHVLEIAPGLFLGPSGEADDFVNHGCDPNCAVDDRGPDPLLWAVRPIPRGEEVTMDYSTTMLTDPTSFQCRCGTAACRGLVTPWPELPEEVRRDYLRRGMVPRFVSQFPLDA